MSFRNYFQWEESRPELFIFPKDIRTAVEASNLHTQAPLRNETGFEFDIQSVSGSTLWHNGTHVFELVPFT